MKHRLCNDLAEEILVVRVWGASSPFAGLPAEASFVGRADVLVFSGPASSLRTVRFAFSVLPGRFASSVVASFDRVLSPAPEQLPLAGVVGGPSPAL